MTLLQPCFSQERIIATGNYFTTVTLARLLKNRRTSSLETMKKITRKLCYAIKNKRKKYTPPDFTIAIIFRLLFSRKKNKKVILPSLQDPNAYFGENIKKLQKQLTATMKQRMELMLCIKCNLRTGTRRWPIHAF